MVFPLILTVYVQSVEKLKLRSRYLASPEYVEFLPYKRQVIETSQCFNTIIHFKLPPPFGYGSIYIYVSPADRLSDSYPWL